MESLMRKVVVITGASSGIGAASAVELAKRGARLVLHGRDAAKLDAVRQQCLDQGLRSFDVTTVTADLNEESSAKKIVQTARDKFGTLHILINNAGYLHDKDGPIQHMDGMEAFDDLYHMYIRSTYMLVQESLPELLDNKGVVLNCSSGLSTVPDPKYSATCVIKAALDHFTRILAMSLGPRGVRVNTFNPAYVKTNLVDRKIGEAAGQAYFDAVAQASPFMQRLATPEEIARAVAFLVSDQASTVTANNMYCDLGATMTSPVMDFTQL